MKSLNGYGASVADGRYAGRMSFGVKHSLAAGNDTGGGTFPPHPLPKTLRLPPPPKAPRGVVLIRPPGSKSLTNRALLLAALGTGETVLRGALTNADDAKVMLAAIAHLGANVRTLADGSVAVTGVGGCWRVGGGSVAEINLNNAGTATRFLAAACAVLLPKTARVVLDGDARMRLRPIGELVDALRAMRANDGWKVDVQYVGGAGVPPLVITGCGVPRGPLVASFNATASSQFISAVLLLAPFIEGGVRVEFTGAITSETYIDMTVGLLRQLRCEVADDRPRALAVSRQAGTATLFPGGTIDVEPDASGASYFLAAGALRADRPVMVKGLRTEEGLSLQGDSQFVRVLTAAGAAWRQEAGGVVVGGGTGVLRPFDFDFAGMPDTVMTAAMLAASASPISKNPSAVSRFANVQTLRVKETDRVAALITELGKVGVQVTVQGEADGSETMLITPPRGGVNCAHHVPDVVFETYHDHRMAMSLALVGLRRPNVLIDDPACVGKTYSEYWEHFGRIV